MRERIFLILSMGITTDIDSPEVLTGEVIVQKKETDENGETVALHIPIIVQDFASKKEFVQEMASKAEKMWDLLSQTIDQNIAAEEEESLIESIKNKSKKDLN